MKRYDPRLRNQRRYRLEAVQKIVVGSLLFSLVITFRTSIMTILVSHLPLLIGVLLMSGVLFLVAYNTNPRVRRMREIQEHRHDVNRMRRLWSSPRMVLHLDEPSRQQWARREAALVQWRRERSI
jgi:hypothetical protein